MGRCGSIPLSRRHPKKYGTIVGSIPTLTTKKIKDMDWRKLFLITYWIRGNDFNAFTFLIDVYIILFVLTMVVIGINYIF